MSARRRTRLIAPFAALLLASGLAACGEEDPATADPTGVTAGGGLENLEVTGDFGEEPEVSFDDPVTVTETETDTVVEGDGEEVAEGDTVLTHVVIANGVSEQVTSSDHGGAPSPITVGNQVVASIRKALVGTTTGSRVVVAAPPAEAFGENGNPELGIGNKDTVVFVIDVLEKMANEPSGTDVDPPAWVPEVVEEGGSPTSLDFEGTPKPTDELRVGYLVRGDGPRTRKGDQVYVHYLGQVYGGKEPFDESYSRNQPFPVELGAGSVVKGWDQGLVGIPVGSRVMLAVPPELGYGKAGNEQAGIKGTDTLYFVVDVLAAL